MLNFVLIFSLAVILFPYKAVSNDALGMDKIPEDNIDISNEYKNLRQVRVPFIGNSPYPARLESTLPQKESNHCEYSEVLQKIWAVLSTYLNNDGAHKVEGPNMNKIRNTLTVVKKIVQDTPRGYQNEELLRKLQELEEELNKDVSAMPLSKKYLRDLVNYNPIINVNSTTDILFKYELPGINQQTCKKAFMRLIQTARDAYFQVAQNLLCNNQIQGLLAEKPDYLKYPINQGNSFISSLPMFQKWQLSSNIGFSDIKSKHTKYPNSPENTNGLFNFLPNILQNDVPNYPQKYISENYLNPQTPPSEITSNLLWQNNKNNGYNTIKTEPINSYLLEKHRKNQESNTGSFVSLHDNIQNGVFSTQDPMHIPQNYLYSQNNRNVLPSHQKWLFNGDLSYNNIDPGMAHNLNKEQNSNDLIHTVSYNLQNKNLNSKEAFQPLDNYLHPQTLNSELPIDQWQPIKNNGLDSTDNLQFYERNPNMHQNYGGSFDDFPDDLKKKIMNPHIGHHLLDNYFKPQNLLNVNPDRSYKDRSIEDPHGDFVHQNNRWTKIENDQMNESRPRALYTDENPMLEFTNIIPNPPQSYKPRYDSSYLHNNPIEENGDVPHIEQLSHGLYPSSDGYHKNPYDNELTNLGLDKVNNKIDKPYDSNSNFPRDIINDNSNLGPGLDSDLSLNSYPKDVVLSHLPAVERPKILEDSFEYNDSLMQQTLPQTSYFLPANLLNKDSDGNPFEQQGSFQNGLPHQNQDKNQIPDFLPPDIVTTGLAKANNYIGNDIPGSKFDSQQQQDVTNAYELKFAHNKAGIIELTYLLKKPKPIVYQPFYFVKYSMPYDTFVHNIKNLLVRKPYLRSDPVKLYHELISESNITEVSPDLKDYSKEHILKLVFSNGTLVNARVIKNDAKLQEQTIAIQDLNSKLQPDASKLELNNLTMQYYNQIRQKQLEEHDLDKITKENVKDDAMLHNDVSSLNGFSNTVKSKLNLTKNTDWIQKGNVNPINENYYRTYSSNVMNRLPSSSVSYGSALHVGQHVAKSKPFVPPTPLTAQQKTVISTSNNAKREISYGHLRQGYGFGINSVMTDNYKPYYQPTNVPIYSLNGLINPMGPGISFSGRGVFNQLNPTMYSMALAGQQAKLNPMYTQKYPNVQPLLGR